MADELKQKHIVCLGGGIGTVNLVRGLKSNDCKITVVVSMADEGGSSGRLRRLYKIPPPGDLISCLGAMMGSEKQLFAKLLTFRFPGDRYGKDEEIAGHKLGNLMMVAARDLTGSFEEAIQLMKKLLNIEGNIYPATTESVSITATTVDGTVVEGEEAIDLGKYSGNRILDKVSLKPENPSVSDEVLTAFESADAIIAGPGDLYTTILPVLIIPKISSALLNSKASKLFVVNVANKPFETKGYDVVDFIKAIEKHLGAFPFDKVIINNNTSPTIPPKYHYTYVKMPTENDKLAPKGTEIIASDIVDEAFPLYHDHLKLASSVLKNI